MKILIVIPIYYKRKERYYQMPLGIAYVNAALRKSNFDVECLNLNEIEEDDVYRVLENVILEKKIECVLCGGISPLWKSLKAVFDICKKCNPSIITVGGGGCFTSEPLIGAEICGVDFAVIGEGEITDVELLTALKDKKSVENIKGIVYKTQTGYIQTEPRQQITELDSLSFPSYDGFNMEKFLNKHRPSDEYYAYYSDRPRIMPMILGRSCPFQCKFCFHPTGNKYVVRSLDSFFIELDNWIKLYNPSCILITDELFSSKVERVLEFCRRIEPYKIKWLVQMRVDIITNELLEIMRNAGCISISYGLESFSSVVLKNMKKHISTDEIERALKLTYDAKIDIQGNFIFGDECETESTIYETLKFWFRHPEYRINLGMIETYPGSGYYNELMKDKTVYQRKEYIESSNWIINLTKMTDDVYNKYRTLMTLLSFYYNPACVKKQRIYKNENNEITVEIECTHCGENNIYHGIKEYISEQVYFQIGCRSCNHRNLIYSHRERLKEWDKIEYLCRMVASSKDVNDFRIAVDVLYKTYMEIRDPENPFPI